jgi:acyl-CoA synthetase (AMP-forming)/AMP-acid ligase II
LEGNQTDLKRLASAGQAFPEVDARTVRPDGTDCGSGEIGEVWLRSATMMQGYWRNPEATKAAIGDGWFRTGDVGYFDDEQYLFIADRKKDMICSGGENIYSREVEEALAAHPAVAEVAVIGVPDAKWGEAVKAFVALKPGARADEAELIEHCRSLIASYKKPRSVQFMSALPRTNSTNKIDKKALREPFWAGHERRVVS